MALVINGERIDDSVIDGEFSGIKAYFESLGNVSCCERNDEFRGYARQNIIARVLLSQEAMNTLPPTPDVAVDEAIEKLIDENGGRDRFFSSVGGEEQIDVIRRDVEVNLRVRHLVDRLANENAAPTDAELLAYYESHLDSYRTAEEVRASHILKAPARGEQREQAYETLREVRRQLIAGADFETLAKAHSDKAEDHVDLGFFKRGELAEEFERVAFSMELNEISPVFASQFGFHVVKLTERKPATPKPFDDVRDLVREHFLLDRQQEDTRKLVERLQAKAAIEEAEPVEVG